MFISTSGLGNNKDKTFGGFSYIGENKTDESVKITKSITLDLNDHCHRIIV